MFAVAFGSDSESPLSKASEALKAHSTTQAVNAVATARLAPLGRLPTKLPLINVQLYRFLGTALQLYLF